MFGPVIIIVIFVGSVIFILIAGDVSKHMLFWLMIVMEQSFNNYILSFVVVTFQKSNFISVFSLSYVQRRCNFITNTFCEKKKKALQWQSFCFCLVFLFERNKTNVLRLPWRPLICLILRTLQKVS